AVLCRLARRKLLGNLVDVLCDGLNLALVQIGHDGSSVARTVPCFAAISTNKKGVESKAYATEALEQADRI
ncbi:hypothetical protein IKQ19_13215, partial [Candidatus Saccharibacteria bacterium]|nr:hypothetical protein [Candidatus Saccharibacteria bacterium]